MSLVAAFAELNEDLIDESSELETTCETLFVDQEAELNHWFENTIRLYGPEKLVAKTSLSPQEVDFVSKHSVISAVDVTYMLLTKHTSFDHEKQISIVIDVLNFLGRCRLPKEHVGGFLILMVKYHFLP